VSGRAPDRTEGHPAVPPAALTEGHRGVRPTAPTAGGPVTGPAPERAGGPGAVPASLVRARALLEPSLRRWVEQLSPEIRRVVGYHLGLSDERGRPASGNGGKAVRPALALLSAEAVGASAEVAVPGAVAVELVHNFSLLHDDVMDRDAERRHRPTAWALFGVGQAIVAGDALMVLATDVLLEEPAPGAPPGPARIRAARALAEATQRMIAGQAEDLGFASRLDVSVEECRRMEEHKTGALLSCAASIGAILAGAGGAEVEALAAFGLHLGLAFQAVDDLLGIWGRPEVTGKPVASDLREHKKSLPVAMALASHHPGAARLRELLADGGLDEERLSEAVRLMEETGARDRALEEAEQQYRLAVEALGSARLEAPARRELEELAAFVTAREF
jgi:geranylgeranyl diphosphate synthase type I